MFKCEICGKELSTSNRLCRHIERDHNISRKDYYDKYIRKENEGICPICGKETYFIGFKRGYRTYCSNSCSKLDPKIQNQFKQTMLNKYGVEWGTQTEQCIKSSHSEEAKQKQKQTNKKKYGVECIFQRPDVIEKTHNKESNAKREQTMIEKYGVRNNFLRGLNHTTEAKEKVKKTCKERYGVENAFQIPGVKEKALKNSFTPEVRIKREQSRQNTNLKLYGVKSYFATEEFKKYRKNKYRYNNISFDSSWELAFYLYMINNNVQIKRNTSEFLTYMYKNKQYKCYPDFIINNVFYEVKGSHFFDQNGNLICPFDKSLNGLYKEKQNCFKKHNVKLISKDEMIPIWEWIKINQINLNEYKISKEDK